MPRKSGSGHQRYTMTAQSPEHAMRTLLSATLLGLAFLLASPAVGQARDLLPDAATAGQATPKGTGYPDAPSPITLHVSAGYQGVYRGTAWTPVRVTLHNGTNADVSGTLQVPQSSQSPTLGSSQSFHGLYQTPVTLPADSTKHVTLYVPGSGVQGRVDATFQRGDKTLAAATAYPMGIDNSALLIGVMASTPGDTAWLVPAIQQQVTTHVARLSPATLDPVPEALAALDLIVLTNVDTSQLARAQLGALERYVQNGGSLLEIGGPTWQQTLRPLPATLLPGHLAGTRILADLHGLLPLGSISRPSGHPSLRQGTQTAAVSVLSHPSGTILAGQAGVPLVVREILGTGDIEYLAFDPALDPVQRWKGASSLLRHLVAAAAPLAISRTWSPQGFRSRFLRLFGSVALTRELSNLPPSTLPLLTLFAILTLVYVLILGPANFLVLRWINRQHLAWITIPALALSYLGSAFGITAHLKGSAVQLNSVGMITLDSSTDPTPSGAGPRATTSTGPATFYLGLVAPLPGDYHLSYNAAALPDPIPQVNLDGFSFRSASTLHSTPLGLRLQEGSQTGMTFLSMKRWSMRDVTLNTTVHIPGTVQSDLGLNAQGDVAGRIHNGTNLDLLDPVIVAGQTVTHLPNIAVGATIQAHVRPNSDVSSQDQPSIWTQLYGGPDLGGADGFGGFRDCCDQFSYPQEKRLIDRVRNATAMLSQSQTLSTLGEVLLIGWSTQPLGSFRVDGSAPQRRDLNLIVVPLSVHFPSHGSFRIRTGTLGAHLVDIVPQAPQSNCCGFFSRNDQQISVGPGGSFTFEFDMPNGGHVRFQRLALTVNGGTGGMSTGDVYDWHAHRWVAVDLSTGTAELPNPNRFVSPDDRIMLKLQATAGSGDLTIDSPYQDVQLSGTGTVT
jgi:hypothetical protein